MTNLYPSPIFGPVHSRRLGVSLGINLMPADGKMCSFDCIYCECGLNHEHQPRSPRPTRDEVAAALENTLRQRKADNLPLDVLTFAGNGEPTLHPDFSEIINDTIRLRDLYFPEAKVSVLSNATMLHKEQVRAALMKVDNNIQKLDTVSMDYIRKIDGPSSNYDVDNVIESLKLFKGHVIVQTMFMSGEFEGSVDNTSDDYILPWIEALKQIGPEMVMIYTIDRDTPVKGLLKAQPKVLDAIAAQVEMAGLKVSVSY